MSIIWYEQKWLRLTNFWYDFIGSKTYNDRDYYVHKSEVQEIRRTANIDNYRVTARIILQNIF